jgi:hypothetical protein
MNPSESQLHLDIHWTSGATSPALDQELPAEIGLHLNDQCLTLLEDLSARTTMTRLRPCAASATSIPMAASATRPSMIINLDRHQVVLHPDFRSAAMRA